MIEKDVTLVDHVDVEDTVYCNRRGRNGVKINKAELKRQSIAILVAWQLDVRSTSMSSPILRVQNLLFPPTFTAYKRDRILTIYLSSPTFDRNDLDNDVEVFAGIIFGLI